MPSPRFLIPFKPRNITIPSLLLLLSAVLVLLYSFHHHSVNSRTILRETAQTSRAASAYRRRFLTLSAKANASIAAHLRALTNQPHLAGTNSASAAASYVLRQLRLAGLETHTQDYKPLLSYPLNSSLSLHSPSGELIKFLSLAEPVDVAGRAVRPYHAYAPSGAAFAAAVYANYGREEDYEQLAKLGVEVRDHVVVVRSGGEYRGMVLNRAADRGAAAALVFGAPGGGVQRGTALLGGPGDPLTPGWPATEEAERLGLETEEVRRRFPRIPSMPVAAVTAAEILRELGGPPPPTEWRNGLENLGIKVNGLGPGPFLVNFTYEEDKRMATIRDIFAVIKGSDEPDRYVILGNHRDAWTYGAVDPNSGTSTLLDVARRYGILLRSGWRPRRTIILCSWDAEEFGMIGSTEWVEQNIGSLALKAVAYLNVDCAVQGPGFFADATPQLDTLLGEVVKQIKDPDLPGMSIYQTWVSANGGIRIGRLARADSDFSAFLHHAGVPSIDMYYGQDFPVYHTALDSYDWMEKHVDPLFHRHVTVAEIWGLLGLHLADDPFLPLDYTSYAAQLKEHANALSSLLDDMEILQPINVSIYKLAAAASEGQKHKKKLEKAGKDDFSEQRRRALNDRLILAERGFLEAEGLRSRQWFKHLIYSPPEHIGSELLFFPSIADAIYEARKTANNVGLKDVQHEIWRVARGIQRAATVLRGEIFRID